MEITVWHLLECGLVFWLWKRENDWICKITKTCVNETKQHCMVTSSKKLILHDIGFLRLSCMKIVIWRHYFLKSDPKAKVIIARNPNVTTWGGRKLPNSFGQNRLEPYDNCTSIALRDDKMCFWWIIFHVLLAWIICNFSIKNSIILLVIRGRNTSLAVFSIAISIVLLIHP